jgi:hypothetical protein
MFSKEDLIKLAQVQSANVRPVKTLRRPKYSRKGYCKSLPKSVLTDKASNTVLGTLIKGTESSFKRNVEQTECRPKGTLADRRIIRDTANVPDNWLHYPEFKHYSVKLENVTQFEPIFKELVRLKLVERSQEFELSKTVKLNSKEHKAIKLAMRHNDMAKVAQVLESCIKRNQVR